MRVTHRDDKRHVKWKTGPALSVFHPCRTIKPGGMVGWQIKEFVLRNAILFGDELPEGTDVLENKYSGK